MSNMQINQYPAAATIDPINGQFLIDPTGTGVYNKINRNTILGITGSPLGTSDTQTISNKTLGNTNVLTIQDSNFTIQNSSDNTKQGLFSLANNTTGTTRTYTMPNASVTLASLTGVETLTNKTITSPTITGGTIANATVTVDAISGFTTSTIVTIANLQISNGVLNSANAVTSVSIAQGAVQPQALVTGTGTGWSWQTWTPSYTNMTIGNGSVESKYVQIGKTVFGRFFWKFGSTSTIGTSPTISFPVAPLASYYTTYGQSVYIGTARLISGGIGYPGLIWAVSSTTMQPIALNASGASLAEELITSGVPGNWVSSDSIFLTFSYETA